MKTLLLLIAFTLFSAFPIQSYATIKATNYQGNLAEVDVVIANGAQLSGAVDLKGFVLVGIIFPAAFTGTALTFETSNALAGTYQAVKASTSGTALSYTVAQATYAAIDPKDFQGIQFLKIKSGSAEGGARTVKLVVKGL